MDHVEVRQAWERAARRAAASGGAGRAAPSELPELYPGVPTFMETPLATGPAELVGADVVVLGMPLHSHVDSGVGRGPAALRRQSRRYSLPRGLGHLPRGEGELVDLERLRIVDYGDVAVDGSAIETTYLRAHEKLADILAAGAVPVVLGGDHRCPSRCCRCSAPSSAASWASSPSTPCSTSPSRPSTRPARSGRAPSSWAWSSRARSCR